MTSASSRLRFGTVAMLIFAAGGFARAQKADDRFTIGDFLVNSVSKRMSMMERSDRFLDIDRLDRQLQVALVIDGTADMQTELESLKQSLQLFVSRLQQVKRDPVPVVSVAVILYGNAGDDQPVRPVIGRFDTDLDSVSSAVEQLQSDRGTHRPHRAVDAGLHFAMTELEWLSPDVEGISRWVIVAGNAPPQRETHPDRRHTTEELIALAVANDIAIYGLSIDNAEPAESHSVSLPDFLAELARATEGHTVSTLKTDAAVVRYWMTNKQEMTSITQADIAALRAELTQQIEDTPKIAILPHKSLTSLRFEPDDDAAKIAIHLRDRLARLGGIDVVNSSDTERAFHNVSLNGRTDTSLAALGQSLDADYVIWGKQASFRGQLITETGLYDALDGSLIARVNEAIDPDDNGQRRDLVPTLFRNLCEKSAQALANRMKRSHAAVFGKVTSGSQLEQELMAPLARDSQAETELLAAQELLEQSLMYAKDSGQERAAAVQLLETAVGHLNAALKIETESPYGHLLLADCFHNLSGRGEAIPTTKVREHLQNARRWLSHLPSQADPIRQEIEAQYALLVDKDVDSAVRLYEELAGRNAGRQGRFDLRAHWMLAGIHLGDWDAASYGWRHVDPNKAREHILAIVAAWPDSPEAMFYKRCVKDHSGEVINVSATAGQLALSY